MPIQIETVAETGSTSADLVARLNGGEDIPEGCWLLADHQTSGRGRQGRSWLDAPGNFMGSTVVRLARTDPPAASLSFVAALTLYESVLPYLPNPRQLMLKWPNDVLLAGDKFSGILLERCGDHAVIGLGINLADAPLVKNRHVGSLARVTKAPSRDEFAPALALRFEVELARWRTGGTAPVFARWLAAAHPEGTPLTVHDASGSQVAGRFAGLAGDGALRLRLADGSERVIHAGDVFLEGD